MLEIAGLVDGGRIKPVVDREFSFNEAQGALDHLESGRTHGKVIVRIA